MLCRKIQAVQEKIKRLERKYESDVMPRGIKLQLAQAYLELEILEGKHDGVVE